MLDLTKTIYVCTHALERWRERAAPNPHAPESEVIAVVRQSKRLRTDDLLPFPRKPRTHYYFNEEFNCYFVVEPIDMKSSRVVTVITPPFTSTLHRRPDPPVTVPKAPEKKKQVTKMTSEEKQQTTEEEYLDLAKQITDIDYKLSGLPKTSLQRMQLVEEKGKLHRRLLEVKPLYYQWKRERSSSGDKKPFRPDGSLNYTGAILALIEKVDKLEAEVAQLRAALKVANKVEVIRELPDEVLQMPHIRIALAVLKD